MSQPVRQSSDTPGNSGLNNQTSNVSASRPASRGIWRKARTAESRFEPVFPRPDTVPDQKAIQRTSQLQPIAPRSQQNVERGEKELTESECSNKIRKAALDKIIRTPDSEQGSSTKARNRFWKFKSVTRCEAFIHRNTSDQSIQSKQSKRFWRKSLSDETQMRIRKEEPDLPSRTHTKRKDSNPEELRTLEKTATFESALEALDSMVLASKLDPTTHFRHNDFSTMTVYRYCESISQDWKQDILHNEDIQALMAEYASLLESAKQESKACVKADFVQKYLEMFSEHLSLSMEHGGSMPEELKTLLKQLILKTQAAYPDDNALAVVFCNFVFQRMLVIDSLPAEISSHKSLFYLQLNQALVNHLRKAVFSPPCFEKLIESDD